MSLELSELVTCPGSDYQCDPTNNSQYGYPVGASPYLAIPAITSSLLSCIGTAVIVYTYCRWKEIRTGSRAIITFLSIADFLTAFGYIVGSLNYAITYYKTQKACVTFTYICQIQSFVTSTSSLMSFFWTVTLALYLYLSLVHNKVHLAHKLFPVYHVFNWGFPLLLVLPLLFAGVLGYSYMAVSTWCFIGTNGADGKWWSVLTGGKLWEILSYLLVIVFYVLIKRHINTQAKQGFANKSLNSGLIAVLRRSDKKLIAIPIVFVLLRCWGTIHYFYGLIVNYHGWVYYGCTSRGISTGFTIFSVLQAIGDGGQGWGNFILYVMVSDKIRSKLLGCFRREDNSSLKHLENRSSTQEEGRGNGYAINYGTTQESKPILKARGDSTFVESYEPTTA